MPPPNPLHQTIAPESNNKATTTAPLLLFSIMICVFVFAALLGELYRHFYSNTRRDDTRECHSDERQALRSCSKAGSWRSITANDECLAGSEYDGKVDEWGLFPEKGAEGADAEAWCEEVKSGYGTMALR